MVSIFAIIIIALAFFGYLIYISYEHPNFKKRSLSEEYYRTVITNYLLSFLVAGLIYFAATYFNSATLSNYGLPQLKNIVWSFLLIDTIYYWIHRYSHFIPFINTFHSIHHTVTELIPLDNFFLDTVDYLIYISLILSVPLLLNVGLLDYSIVIITSLIHSIYLHSDSKEDFFIPAFINSKYHSLHHMVSKGNYSIYFHMWDEYMGTRIRESAALELKDDKTASEISMDEFNKMCEAKRLLIIDGHVIDCTAWLNVHPGGKSVIEQYIGKDATAAFNAIHGQNPTAKAMLKKLTITKIRSSIPEQIESKSD